MAQATPANKATEIQFELTKADFVPVVRFSSGFASCSGCDSFRSPGEAFRKMKPEHRAMRVRLDDEVFQLDDGSVQVRSAWRAIEAVETVGSAFLIYPTRDRFFILPRRAFANDEQVAAVSAWLGTKSKPLMMTREQKAIRAFVILVAFLLAISLFSLAHRPAEFRTGATKSSR